MFRQSPSRSQRSRGSKVKHVMQICFLLAICFWLLYQVKHSRDKKKEFGEGDGNISQRTQSSNEVVKLGRKDLYPRLEETATTSIKQDEENAGEELETKHEDNKFEEKGEEGRGVGDDEIDEHEEEKSVAEVDREEDVLEEEKEKEDGDEKEKGEKDFEDNDSQMENENSLEENDDDEKAHEAREEHYKADDASSAVTHGTEVVTAENENGSSENSNELAGMNIAEKDKVVNNNEESNVVENTTGSEVEDRKMTENGGPLYTTANENMENVGSKSDDSAASLNSTLLELTNDHPELINSTTEEKTGGDSLSMQNKTGTESDQAEKALTEGTTSGDGSGPQTIALVNNSSLSSTDNQANSNLTISTKVENAESNAGDASKTSNSTVSIESENSGNKSTEAEDKSGTSTTETTSATEAEKSEDTDDGTHATEAEKSDDSNDGTGGTDDGAVTTEHPDEVQSEPIDSSDSSMGLEEKEVRTDLETLPDMHTEGNHMDAAAE